MKIVLHGFGSYPVLFHHLIKYSVIEWPEAEWAIALGNSIHLPMMRNCLPSDSILNLDSAWSAELDDESLAQENFLTYHGNIYADIESEKRTFKHRKAAEQRRRAGAFYRVLKRFFLRVKPDYALISQIEGIEGKIFAAVARELGIPLIVPYPCRNLGGYFFSEADEEVVPRYAEANDESKKIAALFLQRFRENPTPAANIVEHSGAVLPDFRPPLFSRAIGALIRTIRYHALFERDSVRVAVLNNFIPLRNVIWGVREWWNRKFETIGNIDCLPRKFVYFPLQYSPESSINSPAPFFVDQFRLVDAIRFAMPSDVFLVVKEHPACLRMRPPNFFRRLERMAGVVLASPDLDSREIVKRALVTVSVTGTAIFEAFIYGRPAICLGGSLVAKYIGGITQISLLKDRLRKLSGISVAEEVIVSGIAELVSCRYGIVFRTPGEVGEPVLRESNIRAIISALKHHTQAVKQ
jgi:hypothetical protein